MRLSALALFLIAMSLAALPIAQAETVNSTELIENAAALDNKTVTYKGEAVTAIMVRGDHAWVNVNDGYNAIGVWCKKELLSDIKWLGSYKNEGDVIQVTGVFHRACPVHGGELDIHADSVAIVSRGFAFEERVSAKRLNIAIIFFILTLVSIFILRKRL